MTRIGNTGIRPDDGGVGIIEFDIQDISDGLHHRKLVPVTPEQRALRLYRLVAIERAFEALVVDGKNWAELGGNSRRLLMLLLPDSGFGIPWA